MRADLKLDDRLTRAMRGGAAALPGDLALLRSYLRLIAGLLEEKATDLEQDWGQACAAAAEIETLHGLEGSVAERAIVPTHAKIHASDQPAIITSAMAATTPSTPPPGR